MVALNQIGYSKWNIRSRKERSFLAEVLKASVTKSSGLTTASQESISTSTSDKTPISTIASKSDLDQVTALVVSWLALLLRCKACFISSSEVETLFDSADDLTLAKQII
ncbi:hypothetical protein BOTCAL_0326g00070 [Botryotinia calthae]|uniref:Uncharacterized protein n=1 Tax=Botryotinia calthae TaxID=38488 RepID=A0A4Y8CW65_9HELO|nr:hypothetical protein BOTCAL_0326g00070 [Botryotinia calthae]